MKRCINSHCVGSHVMGRAKNRLPWRAGKGEWLTMWSKMLSIHSYQKHQRQSSDHPKITIRRKHKTPLNKKTNIIILRKLLYCDWLRACKLIIDFQFACTKTNSWFGLIWIGASCSRNHMTYHPFSRHVPERCSILNIHAMVDWHLSSHLSFDRQYHATISWAQI